jgi:hypothetical protein
MKVSVTQKAFNHFIVRAEVTTFTDGESNKRKVSYLEKENRMRWAGQGEMQCCYINTQMSIISICSIVIGSDYYFSQTSFPSLGLL